MIDGMGRASPPRLAMTAANGAGRASVTGAAADAAEAPAASVSAAAARHLVRDMAASPPVDRARVDALRLAIAAGSYRPDPDAIAARMIALEAGSGRS